MLAGPEPAAFSQTDDRILAEATEDLAAAATLRAAEILLDQVQAP